LLLFRLRRKPGKKKGSKTQGKAGKDSLSSGRVTAAVKKPFKRGEGGRKPMTLTKRCTFSLFKKRGRKGKKKRTGEEKGEKTSFKIREGPHLLGGKEQGTLEEKKKKRLHIKRVSDFV